MRTPRDTPKKREGTHVPTVTTRCHCCRPAPKLDYSSQPAERLEPIFRLLKIKRQLDKLSGVSGWTLHDLRRGVAPHIIERLLNHFTGTISGIAAVYNRAKYLDEMRDAVEKWSARIEVLNRLT